MKSKMMILLLTAGLLSGSVLAQTGRNTFMIGSTVGLSATSGQSENFGNTISGAKTLQLSLSPRMGYFFVDNLAGGMEINYTYAGTRGGEDRTSTQLLAGPFARYYFNFPESRVALFGQASAGFGTASNSQSADNGSVIPNPDPDQPGATVSGTSLFGLGFGPGISFFASDRVGLEALARYDIVTTRTKYNDNTRQSNTVNAFNIQVGVMFYFGGGNRTATPSTTTY